MVALRSVPLHIIMGYYLGGGKPGTQLVLQDNVTAVPEWTIELHE